MSARHTCLRSNGDRSRLRPGFGMWLLLSWHMAIQNGISQWDFRLSVASWQTPLSSAIWFPCHCVASECYNRRAVIHRCCLISMWPMKTEGHSSYTAFCLSPVAYEDSLLAYAAPNYLDFAGECPQCPIKQVSHHILLEDECFCSPPLKIGVFYYLIGVVGGVG